MTDATDAMTAARCVICGEPADGVCSNDCAVAAVRERARNVARWNRLLHEPSADARRAELAMRNGRLTAALISTRSASI